MKDKEKTIRELKEALDGLDITNKYRLNIIRAIEYLQEEPVSEDLKEVAEAYALDDYIKPWRELVKRAFKAGAKWQKQQDQSTIELAEDHAMLAGMEKMKEEMVAKAIDGVLSSTITGSEQVVSTYVGYGEYGKDGDKVKVIVIKED